MEPPEVTIIEGVGDEVTVVAGVIVLITALVLSWLSTYVADGSNPLLGTVVAPRDSSVIHLSPIDHYVGNSVVSEHSEPQGATQGAEEKAEEGPAPDSTGPTVEQGDNSGGSDATLDRLLDIQGLPQRTFSSMAVPPEHQGPAQTAPVPEERESDSGFIKVRLKFLNDTEEVAMVRPEDTIGILKR